MKSSWWWRIKRGLARSALPFISVIRNRFFVRLATRAHTILIGEVGKNIEIKAGVCIDAPEHLALGDNCSIGEYSFLAANGGLRIGANVLIGHHVSIITSNHEFDDVDVPILCQGVRLKPITIEDDVWIGSGARILSGVTIGSGAIVGAGAVVVRDVERQTVVVGVPAHYLRHRGKAPLN